jgi:glycosyltransferase involved in cell wall biosynthesis
MFELARSLHKTGNLEKIITGYPMSKLKNENLPSNKIKTFTRFQVAEFAVLKSKFGNSWIYDSIHNKNLNYLDDKASQVIGNSSLISMSSLALNTARIVRHRGNKFIVNRSSHHIYAQKKILEEQTDIWGWSEKLPTQLSIDRELEEYHLAHKIIVPSKASYNSFNNQGIDMTKIFINPFPIYPSRVEKSQQHRNGILFVGNVSLQKGFPSLIQAFDSINLRNTKLHVAGIYSDTFIKFLKKRNLSFKNVVFYGPVSTEQLKVLYRSCDILVLPSIHDGWGMVVNEAMSNGCIPVVSTGAGASDQIENGINGFVFESGNAMEMGLCILKAMGNEDLRQNMITSINKSEYYRSTWDKFAGIYLD